MGSAIGGAAGGVGSLAGGIGGMIASKDDRSKAQDLINQALAAYGNVQTPTDLANALNLQQYQNAGQLTPAQEQTIASGPSAAAQVKGNANLQNAQMQALNALQGLSQTGMTSADKARLNQIQQQQATQAEGQRQSVLQNFAQRGLGGSGNELMSQLMASQNAANQANQQGLGVAANAQQNALNALSQYGSQAGQVEGQQFGQQTQAANAQDLLNRFNVQNQMQQQARNVANQNTAQQMNLQNQQGIMNANTGMANQELQRQKQAEQQMFQDQMQKAGGISGADFTGSNAYNNLGNQVAQQWSNIGSGVGNIAGGFLGGSGGGAGGAAGGSAGGGAPGGSGGGGMGDMMGGIGAMFAAHGGEVPCYSFGGHVPKAEDKYVRTYGNGYDAPNNYADGGSILDPSLTVGPKPTPPSQSSNSGGGDMIGQAASLLPMIAMLASQGGKVPGKGKVPGDNYKNDTVPARLSPKEIVIPRSISMSDDAPEKAKRFVQNIKDEEE
jgi:hypothetical protein